MRSRGRAVTMQPAIAPVIIQTWRRGSNYRGYGLVRNLAIGRKYRQPKHKTARSCRNAPSRGVRRLQFRAAKVALQGRGILFGTGRRNVEHGIAAART